MADSGALIAWVTSCSAAMMPCARPAAGCASQRFLVDFYRESGVRQEAAVVEVGGLDQGVGLEGAS